MANEVPNKPIINYIPPFDVTQGTTVTFEYFGGSTIGYIITIINKNGVQYSEDNRNAPNIRSITIPANAGNLLNGKNYNVVIAMIGGITEDNLPILSLESDPMSVYCFATPVFEFSTPQDGDVIQSSYVQPVLTYSQANNIRLETFGFVLYDVGTGQQVATSKTIYDTSNLSYIFYNLSDNTDYRIYAWGTTQYNWQLSEEVHIHVQYATESSYSFLELENNPEFGSVKISSNIIMIEGTSNPDPPTFIANNEIDLTATGSYVDFDNNFGSLDNFVVQFIGRNFTDYSDILIMQNDAYTIKVSYNKGIFASYNNEWCSYFALEAYSTAVSNPVKYVIFSNYIDELQSSNYVFVWIQCVDGIFEIKAQPINPALHWVTLDITNNYYTEGAYLSSNNWIVANNTNTGGIAYSTDGINWVNMVIPDRINSVIATRGSYQLLSLSVQAGSPTSVTPYSIYSTRTTTLQWSLTMVDAYTIDANRFWITQFRNHYYITGNYEVIQASNNGLWQSSSMFIDNLCCGLISNNNVICRISESGCKTSSDGSNWYDSNITSNSLTCGASNGETLVCIDSPARENCSIYWGTDGYMWHQYILENTSDITIDFCISDGSRFLAGDSTTPHGRLFYSSNGTLWQEIESPTNNALSGLRVGGNGKFFLSSLDDEFISVCSI